MSASDFPQWRALHAQRLDEAAATLGALRGVRGLVLGGSLGRGEHWPLSDIDLLPVWQTGAVDAAAMATAQAKMVDWWAASGRAQTLDVSWLQFEDAEVAAALAGGPAFAAAQMTDLRWFHGLDKMYGGHGVADPQGVAEDFARWATRMRFDLDVVRARVAHWRSTVQAAFAGACQAHQSGDAVTATLQLREAVRGLRLVLLESWGERLGSMGREWTLWERLARSHNATDLADELADLAGAGKAGALARARTAPLWLQERIRLAYLGRCEVGEPVSEAENARDQLAAFAVLAARRWQAPWPDWLQLPDCDLASRLKRFGDVLDNVLARMDQMDSVDGTDGV